MSEDRVGQVIDGRYLLSAALGRGTTATVWEALCLTTGASVAIKILHAALLPSPTARRRFHRELVNAAALDHPHSIRVEGDGVTPDGADYLVMEHVSGPTLAKVLRVSGALPQLRAIRIAAQILDATAAAHALGIVHRDLKPGNLMLLTDARGADFVKVCDYGIAKAMRANEEGSGDDPGTGPSYSTGQGIMRGTPAYMSPEQVRGEPLDGRADLYAIGVLLFEMVAGRPPFVARSPVDIVGAHLSKPPPRPRKLRPDLRIAPALEALILRALAKDRHERPSSAAAMRDELLQIERDLLHEEITLPGRRRRAVAVALALGAAGVLGVGGAVGWRRFKP